jgi:predicted DNA-binding helix-hairpin-helix protein
MSQLALLSQDMNLEPDAPRERTCHPVVNGIPVDIPISAVQMPGGKTLKVLKTLLTSACERNCYYCPFRAGRDMRRTTMKPEQMADTFMELQRAKVVQGLFLSSGITGGGVRTQDKLLDTVDILRNKRGYRGYIHLKIMPGAEYDQVARAMQLASRLSINLEAPNSQRLALLAPKKEFAGELVRPLQWVEQIRREQSPHQTWNGRWPSTVTQFVVGAVGESDLELISTSEYLYRQAHIQRAYYSAFRPLRDTPFENLPAEDPLRQHRLYQTSFLLRDYGFDLEDLPFDPAGNLPRDIDPKLVWATQNLAHTPVELNTAGRAQLLRIPGIGPHSADVILKARRGHKIRSLRDLEKLGVQTKRAVPFILLDGRKPAQQLALL